jgi:hypothetical protein
MASKSACSLSIIVTTKSTGSGAAHRLTEHLLGPDLHARRRADDDEGAVGRGKTRDRVALEIEIARRVEQVDLAPLPTRRRRSRG